MNDLRPEMLNPEFLLEHIRRDTKFDADLLEKIISEWKRYKATGLEPYEITKEPQPCVFYCNRKCSLSGDWCAEGPGCQLEMDKDQFAHIRGLLSAEKDGRLVVMPCKVGDTLYGPYQDGLIDEAAANEIEISICSNMGIYGLDDFGKTVFLTREEAEAALRGEE